MGRLKVSQNVKIKKNNFFSPQTWVCPNLELFHRVSFSHWLPSFFYEEFDWVKNDGSYFLLFFIRSPLMVSHIHRSEEKGFLSMNTPCYQPLSSRSLTSVIARELVFPSWHKPLLEVWSWFCKLATKIHISILPGTMHSDSLLLKCLLCCPSLSANNPNSSLKNVFIFSYLEGNNNKKKKVSYGIRFEICSAVGSPSETLSEMQIQLNESLKIRRSAKDLQFLQRLPGSSGRTGFKLRHLVQLILTASL